MNELIFAEHLLTSNRGYMFHIHGNLVHVDQVIRAENLKVIWFLTRLEPNQYVHLHRLDGVYTLISLTIYLQHGWNKKSCCPNFCQICEISASLVQDTQKSQWVYSNHHLFHASQEIEGDRNLLLPSLPCSP